MVRHRPVYDALLKPALRALKSIRASSLLHFSLFTKPFQKLNRGCENMRKMKIRCLEGNEGDNYALLESTSTDKDSSTEKQEELKFFNPDGTCQKVVVENHLRTVDLCQILATKNRVTKDVCWSIVEHWPAPNAERFLEDHEDILATYRRVSRSEMRYIFMTTPRKYDNFITPACFFPRDMMAYLMSICPSLDTKHLVECLLWNHEDTPVVFSQGFEQSSENKTSWIRKFFVLKGTRIYTSADPKVVKRFVLSFRTMFSKGGFSVKVSPEIAEKTLNDGMTGFMQKLTLGRPDPDRASVWSAYCDMRDSPLPEGTPSTSDGAKSLAEPLPTPDKGTDKEVKDSSSSGTKSFEEDVDPNKFQRGLDLTGLEFFADLKDFDIYLSEQPEEVLGCPAAIVLRPVLREDWSGVVYFGTASKFDSRCWQSAMRLAKYGKQLKENFITYKGKLQPTKSDQQLDDMKSRVAMDFTGKQGRIVDDPKEAKEIELSEGVIWKKRWKEINPSGQFRRYPNVSKEDAVHHEGPHIGQPWYHGNMSREQSVSHINSYSDKDGLFLVRGSKSKPGCYVLTSKHKGKIIHSTIEPVQLREEGLPDRVYSIDAGITRFVDIYQLVWYYILNKSNLPTKLLHWSRH